MTPSTAPNDNISIIEISAGQNKGVNPLNKSTRKHLHVALRSALSNPSITAIVLTGGYSSKHFSAGADITEFSASNSIEDNDDVPSLTSLCDLMESSPKPIVSAIKGVALGGGFELALSSHYRISSPKSKFGLPEVTIGLIPGAGGTQRLPRLIGVQKACKIIASGRMLGVKEALDLGLIDATTVGKETVEDCAIRWAQYASALGGSSTIARQLRFKQVPGDVKTNHKICDAFMKKLPPKHKGGEAVHSAITAIRASFSKASFEDGMAVEEEEFWNLLLHSAQGRGLRYAFFADRLARRSTTSSKRGGGSKHSLKVQSLLKQKKGAVGVIGAGTMGSGIALSFLRANYSPVYLLDNNEKGLKRGTDLIQSLLQADVAKKRLTKEQATQIFKSLIPITNMQDLSPCVCVIEAVFENLTLKQSIFSKLSSIVAEDTLLLSNTSTLDLNAIASSIPPEKNRGRIAGMHFFSPAHVMKLVEIVVSNFSSPHTIEAVQHITQQIGKVGVVVGNCDGFVGNRMMFPYTSEMVFLLEEDIVPGDGVKTVDDALMEFGMAVGPFIVSDLAGNDIGYLIRKEKGFVRDPKSGLPGPKRPERYTELADELVTKYGRVGQKALKGWYDYDKKIGKGRKPIPSKEVAQHITKYASAFKEKNRSPSQPKLTKKDIVHRILFPLVNEGFKILEEDIARRPSDVDVIYLYGYGWPNWRGGPMYWADNEVGLPTMLRTLEDLHRRYPTTDYFVPSKLLRECVDLGVGVEEYYKRGLNKKLGKSKL